MNSKTIEKQYRVFFILISEGTESTDTIIIKKWKRFWCIERSKAPQPTKEDVNVSFATGAFHFFLCNEASPLSAKTLWRMVFQTVNTNPNLDISSPPSGLRGNDSVAPPPPQSGSLSSLIAATSSMTGLRSPVSQEHVSQPAAVSANPGSTVAGGKGTGFGVSTSGSSETATSGAEPAKFITNTWRMLHDPNYAHLISWDLDGFSFSILDEPAFAKVVLPVFFKHANLPSFVRQLHTYGFRKHPRNRSTIATFSHEKFIKGRPDLLHLISRKTVDSKTQIVRQRTEIQTMQDQIDLLRRQNGRLTDDVIRISALVDSMADVIENTINSDVPMEVSEKIGNLRNTLRSRVQGLQALHQADYGTTVASDSLEFSDNPSLFLHNLSSSSRRSSFSSKESLDRSSSKTDFPSTFWSDFMVSRDHISYNK